ncbi:MAG: DUF2142 domain-containing protein [Eggerthellaceae bacterium]|nr:DUF2142 domain-containing protein [Eggerthellaceae bacterium]
MNQLSDKEGRGALAFWNGDTVPQKAVALALAAFAAFLLATAFTGIVGSLGYATSSYHWGFVLALSFSGLSFAVFRKDLASRPENVFLCCTLVFTCFSSLSYSVNEVSWDLDSHYQFMLEWSDVDRTEELDLADESIMYRADSTVNTEIEKIDERAEELDQLEGQEGSKGVVIHGSLRDAYKKIASMPASVLYFGLSLLGLSFSTKFVLARLVYAVIYSVVLFFGMRRLRSGKMIFATVALYPTMLFIASTYSYDYWVNAFVMTGVAFLVGALQRPDEKLSLREAALMIGAFVIGMGPKAIYFPLILLCLLVPRSSFATARQSRLFRAAVVGAMLFVLLSFAIPYFVVSGPGTGDTRGGSDVNSIEQIKFILSNPVEYAGICLSFLAQYLSIPDSQGYITFYAYLGFCSPWIWVAILLVTAFTALTDKAPCDDGVNTWRARLLVVVLSAATLVLVATSMYVSFTAVASQTVAGCQPRYILPLVFAFLVFIGPRQVKRFAPRGVVCHGLILAAMLALNYAGLWQVYIGLLH